MKCTNEYVDLQQHHLSESNDTFFFRNLALKKRRVENDIGSGTN